MYVLQQKPICTRSALGVVVGNDTALSVSLGLPERSGCIWHEGSLCSRQGNGQFQALLADFENDRL